MSGADLRAIVQERMDAVQGSQKLCPLRGLTAQLAGTGIRFTGLRRCPSLGRLQRSGKRELKRKFAGPPLRTFRQASEQRERVAKVRGGLGHRRTLDRQASSLVPILDCLFDEASLG